MGCYRIVLVAIVSFLVLLQNTQGWGDDGHAIVCKIAQVPSYFANEIFFTNPVIKFSRFLD